MVNTPGSESYPSTAPDPGVSRPPARLSRRRFLSWASAGAASAAGLLVVACGPSLSQLAPTPAPTAAPAAPTTAPAATTAPAGGAATPAATGQPKPTAAAAAKPKPSGQVSAGLSQEPTVFNPLMAHIDVDEGVHYNLFDPLWGADEKGKYFPMPATEVPSAQNGGTGQAGL